MSYYDDEGGDWTYKGKQYCKDCGLRDVANATCPVKTFVTSADEACNRFQQARTGTPRTLADLGKSLRTSGGYGSGPSNPPSTPPTPPAARPLTRAERALQNLAQRYNGTYDVTNQIARIPLQRSMYAGQPTYVVIDYIEGQLNSVFSSNGHDTVDEWSDVGTSSAGRYTEKYAVCDNGCLNRAYYKVDWTVTTPILEVWGSCLTQDC